MDGEQYPQPNIILELDRLQEFAFTKGFAFFTIGGSQNKGRIRFGCGHHGKPRDTEKLKRKVETALERKRQTTTLTAADGILDNIYVLAYTFFFFMGLVCIGILAWWCVA